MVNDNKDDSQNTIDEQNAREEAKTNSIINMVNGHSKECRQHEISVENAIEYFSPKENKSNPQLEKVHKIRITHINIAKLKKIGKVVLGFTLSAVVIGSLSHLSKGELDLPSDTSSIISTYIAKDKQEEEAKLYSEWFKTLTPYQQDQVVNGGADEQDIYNDSEIGYTAWLANRDIEEIEKKR